MLAIMTWIYVCTGPVRCSVVEAVHLHHESCDPKHVAIGAAQHACATTNERASRYA